MLRMSRWTISVESVDQRECLGTHDLSHTITIKYPMWSHGGDLVWENSAKGSINTSQTSQYHVKVRPRDEIVLPGGGLD